MPSTKPMPLHFEKELLRTLDLGEQRTSHNKEDLIRITLRRYLPTVIEEESVKKSEHDSHAHVLPILNDPESIKKGGRVTNIEPWPKSVLKKLYETPDPEWEKIEEAAYKAQPVPNFDE